MQKVKAYGGLLTVTKKSYLRIQTVVFGILGLLLILSFIYNLNDFFFGNTSLVIGIVALLEVAEMFYILRKFK